jgi:hypothetical protein
VLTDALRQAGGPIGAKTGQDLDRFNIHAARQGADKVAVILRDAAAGAERIRHQG